MPLIDDLIIAIYGIITRDDAFAPVLADLARCFECGSAALVYAHPRCPDTTIAVAYGPLDDAEIQTRYRNEFAAFDPAPSAMARLPIGRVASTDEIFKDPLPLYQRFLNGFYYPLGLRGALGGPIADANGQMGMVAVHRGPERAPFGPGDVALMERLTPHIAKAVDLRRRFFALGNRADALAQTFEPLGLALMIFENGQLTEANASARAILARDDGLRLDRRGSLSSPDKVVAARLQAMARATGPGVMSVQRIGGGTYGIRAHGLGHQRPEERNERSAVVICDTDDIAPDVIPLLKEIYGMPGQAAQLVAALLAGASLDDYARKTGKSLNTVKFHLKSAFALTGTRRQTDLMRRVAPLVATLGNVSP